MVRLDCTKADLTMSECFLSLVLPEYVFVDCVPAMILLIHLFSVDGHCESNPPYELALAFTVFYYVKLLSEK